MSKILKILLNIAPIIIMVWFISLVKNDYILTLVYLGIIIFLFFLKREKNEYTIFIFGFFAMIFSEYIFIKTGVEKFNRNSLLGVMPLWLPFLWGYGFVVIKRCANLLND